MPAEFGPQVPAEGLSGLLVVAEPETACSPFNNSHLPEDHSWIALIARSQGVQGCTFDVKVGGL